MNEQNKGGYFVISIDFELFWGMFDKTTLEEYGENIAGERTAIPRMLHMFKKYNIHATWATVGLLMARNKDELCRLLPDSQLQPQYTKEEMSAYVYLEKTTLGKNEDDDIYHYGSRLVKHILQTPFQEIANHTFSHFYCLDGLNTDQNIFKADLDAHADISDTYGIETASIVFPRNQASKQALRTCAERGLKVYRGTENHFLYTPRKDGEQSLFIRALRLVDHYINITGHHTYPVPQTPTGMINVPSSRFLRPWSKRLTIFEPLRIRRIKKAMSHAAKNGEVFHLWWHPHNFGVNQDENFKNLETILEHYDHLQKTYGMRSATMEEISELH